MSEPMNRVEKHTVKFSQSCRRFLSYSLQIIEYGSVQTQSTDTPEERFSHYHRLNYIVEGSPYYYDGGTRINLEPGCLVYLPPNMVLELDPNSPAAKLLFVNFTLGALDMLDDFREFMNGLFTHRHLYDTDGQLLAIMEEIRHIGLLDQVCSGIEIQNLFENLFLHMVRMSRQYQQPRSETATYGTQPNLVRAMAYINSNIRRNFRMSEMAESLNISENYLYKIITSQTGKTPTALITDLRMDIARSSLSNPHIPIKTIASNLGYRSAAHFSNAFKKETGLSPRDFRRQTVLNYRKG